jgi:chromosomal replication initiator protein
MGQRRTGHLNTARQIAMYLAREFTDASLPQIGELLGGRSHTTVLHGCNKVAESLVSDPELRSTIDAIRRQLLRGN